ncbi:hypothetical protein PAECIP111893_02771 [Paenibacillus plantiphilus]|uniref:Lipoprotein n=1 Tax=Paenibacillus plantiphilus TaxID=2905650 RepID=A0ABM9CCC7_9BACL|nr:hypothetical protein [Paenibacillus plantiphilus]CAH1207750.1 hypothetical protein PAECIP111893_02771 [Paenibacillus plantiphilus]
MEVSFIQTKWKNSIIVYLFIVITLLTTSCTIFTQNKQQSGTKESQAAKPSPTDKEEMAKVKKKMELYLHFKYNKEFVVEKIDYEPNTSDYIMDVYVKGDEKIKFLAYKNISLNTTGDTFLTKYWDDEINDDFKQVFDRLFPESHKIRKVPPIGFNLDRELEMRIIPQKEGGKYPTFEQIVEKYPNQFEMNIILRMSFDQNVGLTDDDLLARLYELIKHYRQKSNKLTMIKYALYENEKDQIPTKVLDIVGTEDTSKINEVEDLKRYWHTVNP